MANPNIPSIELLPNQPFVFSSNDPNCLGNDNRDYCVLVNECDEIQIQEKLIFNTDCFEDLMLSCNSFLGAELITNGEFTTDLSGWTAGAGWTWSAGAACNDGGPNGLIQTIAISNGVTYQVSFEITTYTSGDLSLLLGGTLYATGFNAAGAYTVQVTAGVGTDIRLDSNPAFIGCVNNVSVREQMCWSPKDWTFTTESACHVIGSVEPLVSDVVLPAFADSCTYELIVEITGMTTGSLTPAIGTDEFEAITANGTYSLYVNSQGGADFQFTPSSDFDGCMGIPELRRMCDYPTLGLFSLDGDFVIDLSIDGGVSVDIEGRHITWTFKLCQLEQLLDFGCYKFKLFDPCNDCFSNDNIIVNPTFDVDLSGWTVAGGWAWSAGNAMVTNNGALTQDLGVNQPICVRIEVLSMTGNPTFTLRISQSPSGGPVTDLVITTPGVYSLFGSGGFIHLSNVGVGSTVTVNDVYGIVSAAVQPCDPYCYQVESNCLNWRESHECTKHIVAYCEENSLGFNFGSTTYVGTGFTLQERFRIVNFNPTHDKDRNIQLDSAGAKKLVFAQNEKQYQMRFDYLDQRGHDVIAAMMDCDVIQINHGEIDAYPTPYDLVKEYVCLTEDYEPEWAERGERNLAQSQIEITEVPSTIFNQNLT